MRPSRGVMQRTGQYHPWTCCAAGFQTGLCQLGVKTRIPPFWAYVSFFRQLRTWRCQCFRRLVPIADLSRCSNVLRLLDHLVGDGEHPGREGETEHLRSLEIDHKLKLGRLHYRQVSGFGAPKDFSGVYAHLAIRLKETG